MLGHFNERFAREVYLNFKQFAHTQQKIALFFLSR